MNVTDINLERGTGIQIGPDGIAHARKTEEKTQQWALREMQNYVGGYIEMITIRSRPDLQMIVDEDGNPKGKPLNDVASKMYGRPVVGTALIVRKEDLR